MHYVPVLSTLVTFAFAVAVFVRYLRRRGPHLLIWTIGLAFYGLGTLSEVILNFTFSESVLKMWYLSGAMLTAAWLGQGTFHLLVRRRSPAWTLTGILSIVSLFSVLLVFSTPLLPATSTYEVTHPVSSQYKDFLGRDGMTIALTVILNIYGTLTLVGGAIYSAFIFWRKKVLFNRLVGNILIATGAIAPAMAGSFIKLGLPDLLYLSELVGVVVMYLGFLQATVVPTVPTTRAVMG